MNDYPCDFCSCQSFLSGPPLLLLPPLLHSGHQPSVSPIPQTPLQLRDFSVCCFFLEHYPSARYGLICVSPKKVCGSPNSTLVHQNVTLFGNELCRVKLRSLWLTLIQYNCCVCVCVCDSQLQKGRNYVHICILNNWHSFWCTVLAKESNIFSE